MQTVTKDSQTNVYDYHYTYDENGRMLTSVQTYGGKTYEYTYGQEGQILTGTCTDENGRVEDVALNYTLSYDYDQDGNLLEQVKRYDAGRIETVNYVYDDAGNLIRETEWTNNLRLHEIEYTYELSYQPAA